MKYIILFMMLVSTIASAKNAEIFYRNGTTEVLKDISASNENKLRNMSLTTTVVVDRVVNGKQQALVINPQQVVKVQVE